MFELYAEKNQLCVKRREPVTSGSVNIYDIRFAFSEDWAGLTKTAVFRAGEKTASVLLGDTGETVVPWEVLTVPGKRLEAGVYGTRGNEVVLPTVWADLVYIQAGAAPGDGARPPTPDLWKQELAKKGDGLELDGLNLKLLSGEKTLSEVELPPPGGGEGGTTDHRYLTHRDEEGQHPIKSIEGLEEEIKRIPAPVEPLTNEDLEAILK